MDAACKRHRLSRKWYPSEFITDKAVTRCVRASDNDHIIVRGPHPRPRNTPVGKVGPILQLVTALIQARVVGTTTWRYREVFAVSVGEGIYGRPTVRGEHHPIVQLAAPQHLPRDFAVEQSRHLIHLYSIYLFRHRGQTLCNDVSYPKSIHARLWSKPLFTEAFTIR
ncbi:hypothetical protein P280DRAFT_14710 [Massarina eburnea CBS 473.64]|uniref:Uncharacterized protein n=1 Tax=Massarina eburnea CBS 473.64 TaxID=1395130 RepID=A0A6A6SFK5_9PLEO|nr:hypothetical protein P280DRAFT_14710 [Massarina eburnea CBS 473.64]